MKILILEDHAVYRDGIRNLLQQIDGEYALLEAETGQAGIALVSQHFDLDLVLIDIHLSDMNGFDAMREFQALQATLPMVILTASNDLSDMKKALDRGAMGYIPKTTPADVMLSAIQLVLSGGIYIPPEMLELYSLKQADENSGIVVTNRQQQVLDLLLEGECNKEIVRTLELSLSTVKSHMSAIFKSLNVKNRTEAIVAASRVREINQNNPK